MTTTAPCPFCGGTDLFVAISASVHCNGCQCDGPLADDPLRAIELWERARRDESLDNAQDFWPKRQDLQEV